MILVDPDYSTVRMCSRAFQNDGNSYAILVLASVLVYYQCMSKGGKSICESEKDEYGRLHVGSVSVLSTYGLIPGWDGI